MSGVRGGRGQPIRHRRPSAHRPPSFPGVLAVSLINEALEQGSPEKTLAALLLPSAGLDDVSLPVAPRYHLLLVAAKRQKAQVRSASVPGAGRASPVGRAVPRMHLGRAQSDDGPVWVEGRRGRGGRWHQGQVTGPHSGRWQAQRGGASCGGGAQAWGPENPGGAGLPALTHLVTA